MRAPRTEAVAYSLAGLGLGLLLLVLGMAVVKVGPAQMAQRWWVVVLLGLPPVWAAFAVWLARGCGRAARRVGVLAAGAVAGTMALVAVQVASESGWLSPRLRPLSGTAVGWGMAPAIGSVVVALGAVGRDRWRRDRPPGGD